MMTPTLPDLIRFAPAGKPLILSAVTTHWMATTARWKLTTAARVHMFLAQMKVESAGFTAVFENMDYSAERIHQVWPNRFKSVAAAEPYAHNPQKLANVVYGGRMGNVGPNDGWYARGAGLLQVTGMTAYGKLAKVRSTTIDQTRADLTDPKQMLDCAAATFVGWGLLPYADKGDVWNCTKALNGGLTGLADREAAFALAQKVWPAKAFA